MVSVNILGENNSFTQNNSRHFKVLLHLVSSKTLIISEKINCDFYGVNNVSELKSWKKLCLLDWNGCSKSLQLFYRQTFCVVRFINIIAVHDVFEQRLALFTYFHRNILIRAYAMHEPSVQFIVSVQLAKLTQRSLASNGLEPPFWLSCSHSRWQVAFLLY